MRFTPKQNKAASIDHLVKSVELTEHLALVTIPSDACPICNCPSLEVLLHTDDDVQEHFCVGCGLAALNTTGFSTFTVRA